MATTSRIQSFGLLLIVGMAMTWLLAPLPVDAAAVAEPAGYVLTASGEVVAVQANKELRQLKRKSPFFPGESLRTGETGKAQLRFRDGSLIALRASSEIRLDEFRFNEPQKGGDKNIFTLISGGFRTITGKIGKGDPEAYQMKSSVASIGVRGTTYEAVLNGGLDVAAWQGTIIVANGKGQIAVGAEGLFNFASVQSHDHAPRGLMKPPPTIRNHQEIHPDEQEGERPAQEGGGQDTVENEGEGPKQEPEPEPEPDLQPPPTSARPIITPDVVITPADCQKSTNSPDSCNTTGSVSGVVGVTTPPSTTPPPPVVSDARIDGITLDRIAMAVGGGSSYTQMVAGGKAGYNGSGTLHIADNGLDPSQVGFDTTPYINVLSQGLAVAAAPSTSVIDANHTVEWGVWQATATSPAYLMTDPTNAAIYTAIDQPLYWITALPSNNAALAARTGKVEYRNVLGFSGASNSGAISNIYMRLSVNFDSAAATGDVHIYAPGQYWDVDLIGSVAAPTLNFTSVSGTLNGSDPISGEFSTLFTGDSGQALVNSFDVASIAAPSLHLEGVVLVNDVSVADVRLLGVTLDRVGMYQRVDNVAGFNRHVGLAGVDLSSNLYFTDNGYTPDQPLFQTAPALSVLSQGSAPLLNYYSDGLYPVTWGIWDGVALPATLRMDGFDPLSSLSVNTPVHWLTVTPTTVAALSGLTSPQAYMRVRAFDGIGSDGNLVNMYANLQVGFDTGLVSGDLHYYTANQLWAVTLGGAITAPGLNITTVNGTLNGSLPVTGAVGMLFTGTNGEALAGMGSFEVSGDPTTYLDTMFLLDITTLTDLRLTAAEWASVDRVGLGYVASGLTGSEKYWGKASDGASGSPILASWPSGVASGVANKVVQQGGATLRAGSAYSDPAYQLSWGIWDATVSNAATAKNSFFDPLDQTNITKPLLWMTLTPTPNATTFAMTGQAQYKASGLNKVGFDNDGDALWTAQFGVHVNFDTAQFKGTGFVEDVGTYDDWLIDFSGVLNGSHLDVTTLTGNYNGVYGTNQPLAGDLEIYFLGNSAEAFAGAFDLEWVSDPSKYVVGAFEGYKDLRLTNAETAAMNRIGLGLFRNNAAGAQLYQGLATSGISGTPILTHNGFLMSDSRFYSTAPNWVIRQGTAPNAAWFTYSTDPTYGVSWGAWDAGAGTPVTIQDSITNGASVINQTTPVMWMTVLPTDNTLLAAKTGAARYTTTYGSMARTGLGYFASTSHYLRVDFDAGTFTGTAVVNDLEMATAGTWNVSYNGWLFGPNLDASTVTGKYTGYWGADLAVGGDVSALFTGGTGEALAGAFEFDLLSNPNGSVQGVFISQQDLRLSNAEVQAMDHAGLFVASGTAYDITLNSSGDGGSVPLFGIAGTQYDPQNPKLSLLPSVARLTGTESTPLPSHNVAGDVNYRVNWGKWNGGFDVYTNPLDPTVKTFNPNDAYWMTLVPTPPANIPTTGVITYNGPVGIVGGSPLDGAIVPASFTFSANVDFGTATLSGGTMGFTAGTTPWTLTGFSGSFATQKGEQFPVAISSGLRNGVETVTGNMNLLFTGPAVQGLAGGFQVGTGTTTAEGVFLVCQSGGC